MRELDLFEARAAVVEHASLCPAYLRQHGIDWWTAEEGCGGVFFAPVVPMPPRSFMINPAGDPAVIIEALADDAETILDLVSWRPDRPERWRRLLGSVPALGLAAAVNPGTYAFDHPLRLHRTPLRWLQAGCDGAVLLDTVAGARWLLELGPVRIAAEDDAHAAELHAARLKLATAAEILVPEAA